MSHYRGEAYHGRSAGSREADGLRGGLALSVMVKEPLREPLAVGVKVTLRVQLALAARLAPQVLV